MNIIRILFEYEFIYLYTCLLYIGRDGIGTKHTEFIILAKILFKPHYLCDVLCPILNIINI